MTAVVQVLDIYLPLPTPVYGLKVLFWVKLHKSVEKIIKTMKWHNKNTKYKCTVQMMNEDLDDVYCNVQHIFASANSRIREKQSRE
jgi:hypothetical protein